MFRIFRSEWYERKFDKLDKSEQQIVSKFEQKLKLQPYEGRPLGFKFFREKKFDGKRILFLVYDNYSTVFLVTITDKRAQQQDINLIKTNLDIYKDKIMELLKNI